MKSKKAIGGALAVTAVLVLFAFSMRPDASPFRPEPGRLPGSPEASLDANSGRPTDTASGQPTLAAVGPTLEQLLPSRYRREPGNPLDLSVSDEDAEWLHAHGYPDPDMVYLLRNAPIDDVERIARQDLRAQVLLAQRLAMEGGQGGRPLALLDEAAAKGSVHALMVRADIHAVLPEYRNLALASAYYRLAFRRGQFVGLTTHQMMTAGIDSRQRLMADLLLETEWSRLQAIRLGLGLPAFAPTDMRPGLADFLNQVQRDLIDAPAGG